MRWVLSARDLFVPIAGGFGGRGGGVFFLVVCLGGTVAVMSM